MTPNPVLPGNTTVTVEEERKADAKLLLKAPDHLGALLEVYPEDHQTRILERPVERLFGGSLPPAIGSGGCKEPQQDDLAAEVGQADLRTLQVRQRKIMCWSPRLHPNGPERHKRIILRGGQPWSSSGHEGRSQ